MILFTLAYMEQEDGKALEKVADQVVAENLENFWTNHRVKFNGAVFF